MSLTDEQFLKIADRCIATMAGKIIPGDPVQIPSIAQWELQQEELLMRRRAIADIIRTAVAEAVQSEREACMHIAVRYMTQSAPD